LTKRIREADEVYVSAVTAWEVAIKSALGKIVVKATVAEAIAGYVHCGSHHARDARPRVLRRRRRDHLGVTRRGA